MADEVAAGVEAMKVGDDATAAPAPAPAAEPAAAETTAEPEAADTAETTEAAAPAPEPAAAGGGGGAGGGAGADEDAGGDGSATEGNGDGAEEGGDGDGDDDEEEEDEAGDQLGEMGPATPRRKPRSKKKRFSFNPAAAEPSRLQLQVGCRRSTVGVLTCEHVPNCNVAVATQTGLRCHTRLW